MEWLIQCAQKQYTQLIDLNNIRLELGMYLHMFEQVMYNAQNDVPRDHLLLFSILVDQALNRQHYFIGNYTRPALFQCLK